MKRLPVIMLSLILLLTCFVNSVAAHEVVPEMPEATVREETNEVTVCRNRIIKDEGLSGNIEFKTSGTVNETWMANELVSKDYDLSTQLDSYTVYSGSGYPTMISCTYYLTAGGKIMAHVTVEWHEGQFDGLEREFIFCVR